MDRKNGSPASKVALGSFVKGTGYRRLGFLALLGTVYGVVVGSVLSTNPSAIAIVKCVVPVCAIVGIVAGVGYGFFFNISNRCTGGRLVWGIILGFGAVAAGTLLVSLLWVSIGALVGFVGGWMLGSILSSKWRGGVPWIGAIVGAMIQAGWSDPTTAVQTAVLYGAVGAIAVPVCLLMCIGLGYFLLRHTVPPRHPMDE